MNTYPVTEQRIAEVERGRSCDAILPLPPGGSLAAGDEVLFAVAQARAGRTASFASWGDSVLVSLTNVIDLDKSDPASGHPLFRVQWKPLGQEIPPGPKAAKARRPR
jgi:hypothetical protein